MWEIASIEYYEVARKFLRGGVLSCDHRVYLQRMSELESSSSYFSLEDPQWLCMVTLFIASVVTLILYFIQYFQQRGVGNKQRTAGNNAAKEEAAALLRWALSLKSWKSQWRGAWCRALNDESRKHRVSLMTTKPSVCSVAGDFNKQNAACHRTWLGSNEQSVHSLCFHIVRL